MPHRQWTMLSGPAYRLGVDDGRVVMVGKLRADLESALRATYGAVPFEDLGADAAALVLVQW
jgi:phosphoglycolate phosphatase-like HAD superfamily hydrolase